MNSINVEVILASHCHHVPHVGIPQIDPEDRAGSGLVRITDASVSVRIVVLGQEYPLGWVLVPQSHDVMYDSLQAPSIEEIWVLRHVDSVVDRDVLSCDVESQVMS